MAIQEVTYEGPNEEDETVDIEIEPSSAETIDTTGKKYRKAEEPKPEKPEKSADTDVEYEVVDDTPPEDRDRKPSEPPEEPTEEELTKFDKKIQDRFRHLTKGYHDERRAKEAAFRERDELQRLAQKLVEDNKKLEGNLTKGQQALVEQAKKTANSEIEAAKRAYREAYEAGDTDALVEAQDALVTARTRAERLANYRPPQKEAEQEVNTGQGRQAQPQQPAPQQAQPQVDPKALQWKENNPWFGDDDEMTASVLGLHRKLVQQGVDPTTDEYYQTIDRTMRKRFPENFSDVESETEEAGSTEQPRRQASSSVVAPATRNTSPKKITLTKTQVALANKLGIPLDVYAKEVAKEMRKANG